MPQLNLVSGPCIGLIGMDIKTLEDFIVLAEQKNFTRAAEVRNSSQAAFSRRIKNLEYWVGTALVKKGVQPVSLTDAGHEFLEEARRSVENILHVRAGIRSKQFEDMSQVKVGTPFLMTDFLFSKLKGAFARRPKESYFFQCGSVTDTINRFLAGSSDILLSAKGEIYSGPLNIDDYDKVTLSSDKLCLVGHNRLEENLASSEYVDRKKPIPICMYDASSYFSDLIEHILDAQEDSLPYKVVAQTELSSVVKFAVLNEMSFGWVPRSLLSDDDLSEVTFMYSGKFDMNLEFFAVKSKKNNDKSVLRIWNELCKFSESSGA